ncbi:MAG: hypothetical protein V2A74_10480, partial [bacterium]
MNRSFFRVRKPASSCLSASIWSATRGLWAVLLSVQLAAAQNVQVVGSIGGPLGPVVLEGKYACIGEG